MLKGLIIRRKIKFRCVNCKSARLKATKAIANEVQPVP